MRKCKMKCWPGYRRVSGKGCGKGSCVKKGTKKRESKRSKRVRRRVQKKRRRRGSKRRYKRRSYRMKSKCVPRTSKMNSKRRYRKRSKRRKSKKSRMSCNRVKKSYRRGKKFMVKACSRGKEKLIHFGATGYGHNYSRKARKSYRARHRCKSAKNKLSARYWSCKHSWTRGGSRRRCPKGRRCKR